MSDEDGGTGGLEFGGARLFPGYLGPAGQKAMVGDLRSIVAAAPLVRPETRSGRRMSVRITAAGTVGWISDRAGYRYADRHPGGGPWPPIPESVLAVWRAVSGVDRLPDCCLLNLYGPDARLGLHQDRDEACFDWPVVSISLGDEGLFRIGGTDRGGRTQSRWLQSGDVLVLAGSSRLAYHGIDRIRPGSSSLLPGGGRINLTLRVAL